MTDEAVDSWWAAIDAGVIGALTEAGGWLTLADIAARVGISEDAARSVVSMLAEEGKVRIAAVELVSSRLPLATAPARTRAPGAPLMKLDDRPRATP